MLKIKFCGISFKNPLVLASGVCGVTAASLRRTVALGAGGITTKSIWNRPHPGHPNPTMFGTPEYFMNAVGLSDAGIEKARETLADYLPDRRAPLIANIVGGKKSDFCEIIDQIEALPQKPDAVEINISCPNVEDEFGTPFACDRHSAEQITREIRKRTKLPLAVKLSPNVANIAEIARVVEASGADAITAINTVGPGMRWNIDLRQPLLANRVGGISGPAIFPIAVRAVFEIFKSVKIPIIATGGVNSGRDALEIMMAGGTLVGIGTAIFYHGDEFWKKATDEMVRWLEKNNFKSVEEIVGIFHEK